MTTGSPLLTDLIEALRCLPGVGAKTAQRMAFHVLERDRAGARRLSERLALAIEKVGNCGRCRGFSEQEICSLCANASRDKHLLCIVETPVDQLAIETATGYRGHYFVLLGRLSPMDGLGPKELGLDLLAARLGEGEITEMIVATNPTVEGEATAHMLSQLAKAADVKASRLAHGVPLGGELEFIDRGTLAHAFGGRQSL
ncbi:MAG TPA: recombination mediator RecR [Dokdonella sp.]|uniref:recombination mediator RecR n=1 Tax=Dokdonella sp. TaxID=2291710 RepID=UPI002D7F28B5|nr:recombination mediator RecR [Dokdonella sp.]HET9031302.1 recombination mediator RecR [Dokdonella sp.]